MKLKAPDFQQPVWLGDGPIAGKTILLHSDQGLGDAINFARYAPMVAAKGARVVLAVEGPLMDILSSVEGVAACVNKDGPLPAFDVHCPLSSLPLAFATRLDTIPAAVPYIARTPPKSGRRGSGRGTRRGSVWCGRAIPNHGNDHNRSLRFAQIAPLLDLPISFYSLQKDVRACDIDELTRASHVVQLGDEIGDFADTTALLSELDLLITADTSIAHIAGAMAMPTWIMLPHTPDWRWLLNRSDSPWYPSMRLFRQPKARDWESVVMQMRQTLQAQFATAPAEFMASADGFQPVL